MVTGDNDITAKYIAKDCGIYDTNIFGDLKESEKFDL
jgi:magnesium-transporting ATPase (P-type)